MRRASSAGRTHAASAGRPRTIRRSGRRPDGGRLDGGRLELTRGGVAASRSDGGRKDVVVVMVVPIRCGGLVAGRPTPPLQVAVPRPSAKTQPCKSRKRSTVAAAF